MQDVVIIIGSISDAHFVWDSKMLDMFDEFGISYEVSACSAHRNAEDLREHVHNTMLETGVYVCAAGMAAALPGAVKALLLPSTTPVIGIALPSPDYPGAEDAIHGITRLPPGVTVLFGGVGVAGFNQTAMIIAEAFALRDETGDFRKKVQSYTQSNTKKPQFRLTPPNKEE